MSLLRLHAAEGALIGLARHVAALLVATFALAAPLAAQTPPPRGLLAPGDAAVTGFSGALAPVQLPLGADPAVYTFIDLNGAALRIFDLQDMGGPPEAQLVPSRTPFAFPAGQIGQVFGVALDNQVPPNIYAAASSAYGLPIMVQGPDGVWTHARTPGPGAVFMPGQWGAVDPKGGPGSIWKIDGVTGAVTLFATIAPEGRPNSGAALGNLAFDGESDTLFVADRETGLIHRLDMQGRELARYDHGVSGRRAAGLTEIAFDPARRLDITDPAFDPAKPDTWNYAPAERRVYGLAVRGGRLFYSVAAGEQVWSVAFTPAGMAPAFADPSWELSVPGAAGEVEISKIAFDDEGRMLLAERAAPSGAFDFRLLAPQGVSRVLRYQLVRPYPGLPRTWQPEPDEYALGFPGALRNGDGGLAIGYSYDRTGRIERGSCGGFLWMTGDELRKTDDPTLVERLRPLGPANVEGFQGNPLWTVRPMNTPPVSSYFLDYDSRFDLDPTAGRMGDMAIWRGCGPMLRGGWMLPGWFGGWFAAGGGWGGGGLSLPPSPPKLACPVNQQKPGFQCCPAGTVPGAGGQCSPVCPNGASDPFSQKLCALGFDAASYDPLKPEAITCLGGGKPLANKGVLSCAAASPVLDAATCPAGWSKQMLSGIGMVCAPKPDQMACPPGQQAGLNGQCAPLCLGGTAWPASQCCASGSAITPTGQCCPAGSTVDPKTGACGQVIVGCLPGSLYDPVKGCTPPVEQCPEGFKKDGTSGQCQKIQFGCLPGLYPIGTDGACLPPPPLGCVPGMKGCEGLDTPCQGAACAPPPPACPVGWTANMTAGGCCPPGQSAGSGGKCAFEACPAPGKLTGGKCCSPDDLAPGGACAADLCGAGAPTGAAGACCPSDRVYQDKAGQQACCANPLENGQCGGGPLTGDSLTPQCGPNSTDPKCCPAGYAPGNGSCCLQTQLTSTGICCPNGQAPGGPNKDQCSPPIKIGTPPDGAPPPSSGGACCAPGSTLSVGGSCCPVDRLTSTGFCCGMGKMPDPKNRRTCVAISSCDPRETPLNGACCRRDRVYTDAAGAQQCCNGALTTNGKCLPLAGTPVLPQTPAPSEPGAPQGCAPGYSRTANGACCANAFVKDGRCVPPGAPAPGPGIIVPGVPFPGMLTPPRNPPPPPPVVQPLPNRPVVPPPAGQTLPNRPPGQPVTRPPVTRQPPVQVQPARPLPSRPPATQTAPPKPARPSPSAPPAVAPAPRQSAPQGATPNTQPPKAQLPKTQAAPAPAVRAAPAPTTLPRRPPPKQQDPNAPVIR